MNFKNKLALAVLSASMLIGTAQAGANQQSWQDWAKANPGKVIMLVLGVAAVSKYGCSFLWKRFVHDVAKQRVLNEQTRYLSSF